VFRSRQTNADRGREHVRGGRFAPGLGLVRIVGGRSSPLERQQPRQPAKWLAVSPQRTRGRPSLNTPPMGVAACLAANVLPEARPHDPNVTSGDWVRGSPPAAWYRRQASSHVLHARPRPAYAGGCATAPHREPRRPHASRWSAPSAGVAARGTSLVGGRRRLYASVARGELGASGLTAASVVGPAHRVGGIRVDAVRVARRGLHNFGWRVRPLAEHLRSPRLVQLLVADERGRAPDRPLVFERCRRPCLISEDRAPARSGFLCSAWVLLRDHPVRQSGGLDGGW
jgi:hypothetical protein